MRACKKLRCAPIPGITKWFIDVAHFYDTLCDLCCRWETHESCSGGVR